MKTTIILLFVCVNGYSQELDTLRFFENIKEKIFKVQGHDDVYYDLNRKSLILIENSYNNHDKKEELVNFNYEIYPGSFLNKYHREYLFIVTLDSNSFPTFFAHAENYGNTTLIYIFDSSYNQISDVG